MAWMMELASLIFLTDVLFSKSAHSNATIYLFIYLFLSKCMLCTIYNTFVMLYSVDLPTIIYDLKVLNIYYSI